MKQYPVDSNTTRDKSLDSVCGFFIIIMMLWHTGFISERMYHVEHFFYFFVPWFFYKAGMFARYGQGLNKEALISSFNRLIVPCFIFALYGLFVQIITDQISGSNTLIGTVRTHLREVLIYGTAVSNKPVWFLISLFSVRLLFSFSTRYNVVILSAILALSIAFLHQHYFYNRLCFFGNIPLGYLYYIAGYYLKEKQYNKFVLWGSIVLFSLEFIFLPTNVDARGNLIYYGNWIVGIICSVFGIIVINNLFRLNFLQFKALSYVGKNSIHYLVVHYPIIWLSNAICVKCYGGNHVLNVVIVTLIIFIISSAFSVLIKNSKYEWIVGGG